jgi:hypothetical protein
LEKHPAVALALNRRSNGTPKKNRKPFGGTFTFSECDNMTSCASQ